MSLYISTQKICIIQSITKTIDYIFHSDVYNRITGGSHIVYSFGNWHQLPPVGMKVISDMYNMPKMNTSDFHGFFTFNECLYSTKDGTRNCSVVIEEVVI